MDKCKPYIAMIAVQFAYAGLTIISKAALNRGMSHFVLVVYRHVIATVILSPFAYFIERKERPSLTFSSFCKIFLLALCGTTIHQNLYYAGLYYTSPTFACALSNMIPAMTFLMSLFFRLEKLSIRSLPGQAKLLGTVVCIGGALIVTLYKGPVIRLLFWSPILRQRADDHTKALAKDWAKGSLFIVGSYIAWCTWLILQATITEIYPAQLSMTTLLCFLATLQSAVTALIFERSSAAWILEWNIQLLSVIYAGIVISGISYWVQTWCIGRKGPVFSAMFTPLLLIIVALMSSIIFAERLHLGTVGGGVLTVGGLYAVLWGKRKDGKDVRKILEIEDPEKNSLEKPSDKNYSAQPTGAYLINEDNASGISESCDKKSQVIL